MCFEYRLRFDSLPGACFINILLSKTYIDHSPAPTEVFLPLRDVCRYKFRIQFASRVFEVLAMMAGFLLPPWLLSIGPTYGRLRSARRLIGTPVVEVHRETTRIMEKRFLDELHFSGAISSQQVSFTQLLCATKEWH
jgi:hypothetical protein